MSGIIISTGVPVGATSTLPKITQTLIDGTSTISLGGYYTVVGMQCFDSTGISIPFMDWAKGTPNGNGQVNEISITSTGVSYSNAEIYVFIKN